MDSAAFIPVPHEIRYGEAEKSGLELVSNAKNAVERTSSVFTDIESLERAIEEVLGMLDRVAKYVEAVIDEEAPPSSALGQFLLNTLALAPKVDPGDIERDLWVVHMRVERDGLTFGVATIIYKTSSSFHTSPTRYGRRSTSRIG